MAYETTNPPSLVSQRIGAAGKVWMYLDGDAVSTVVGASYFTNGYHLGMRVGDAVMIVNSSTGLVQVAGVTTATASTGYVTVTASISGTIGGGGIQTLTASGAVTAGIQYLNVAHATVVIAATIASAVNHAGIFVITNTSASGTAAHTVTLTAGTFNAAGNTIATLNAAGEQLVTLFSTAGVGCTLENTGAVAMS